MSIVIRNGKAQMERKPKGIDAPTPSQIAARAYDLAIASITRYIDSNKNHNGELPVSADEVRDFMNDAKDVDLRLLRESVINPAVIPWWRK